MREQVEDSDALIERWIEVFDMVLTDDGKWSYDPTTTMGRRYWPKPKARAPPNSWAYPASWTVTPRLYERQGLEVESLGGLQSRQRD